MSATAGLGLAFAAMVGGVVAYDLAVLQRRAHAVSLKEAAGLTALWAALALLFAAGVWKVKGAEPALQFLAGYLLEESLSVDNMFVFLMIFHYFDIAPLHQGRVLHWGIVGAVVLRFLFIFAGVALIQAFHWMTFVFGGVLVLTGLKMLLHDAESSPDPSRNPALRLLKRVLPVSARPHGQDFLARIDGVLHATPLLAALVVIEFSDVVFALDSIPAVIAVTPDPFIVYTSNIFAIMGLRALYFLLAGLVTMFRYLKVGISLILLFVGLKMICSPWWHVPIGLSLGLIAATLSVCVGASWVRQNPREPS